VGLGHDPRPSQVAQVVLKSLFSPSPPKRH